MVLVGIRKTAYWMMIEKDWRFINSISRFNDTIIPFMLNYFSLTDMKSGGKLLSPEQSIARLIHLLRINSFESGAHVDYYDIEMPSESK